MAISSPVLDIKCLMNAGILHKKKKKYYLEDKVGKYVGFKVGLEQRVS